MFASVTEKFSGKYTQHIAAAALTLAILVVFWQVLGHGFVFDDDPYVADNPHVNNGLSLSAVKWAFTGIHGANWHPLTSLSHMLDSQLYGLKPRGHHLTNLLFHIANTILLLLVLTRMTGSFWRSSFVAALFAVHPLHVESVAWIAERKDVLSTFFWLLTMWAYLRYAQHPNLRRYATVAVLFALGLMAKPMLVSLPFVLLLLDYWPLGRLSLGDRKKRNFWSAARKLIWEKAPLFALAAASSVVTIVAQQKGGAMIALERFPFGVRAGNAVVAYVEYIVKSFWPKGLAAYYPHPVDALPAWQVAGACLLLPAVSVLVMRAARHHPYLAVGWLWYVVTLVPVIGLVQVGEQSMADRYTYIPLIGVFVMVAWGVPALLRGREAEADEDASSRPRVPAFVLPTLAGAVIPALMICAWLQVRYWHSDLTLFERAVRVTTGNWMAHNNLGIALAKQGKIDEAIAQYSRAAEIKPGPLPYNNLGGLFARQGKLDKAITYYTKALEVDPQYKEAHYNLGNALVEKGRLDEAEDHYSKALEIDRGYSKAYYGLAQLLAKKGKGGDAVAQYSKLLKADPNNADAHLNFGLVLYKQGRVDEAISHFSRAVRIKPRYVEAHNFLGVALAEQGKLDEAVEHYSEALRIKPDYAEAHHNFAMALVKQGETAEAIDHFSQAIKAKPDFAEAHNQLGVALATQGRIDEAVPHFRQAVRLKPGLAEAHYNLGLAMSAQGKSDEAIAHYSQAVRVKSDYADAHLNLAVEFDRTARYAEAWREVHLCRKYGVTPHPGFLAALSQKFPDPGE